MLGPLLVDGRPPRGAIERALLTRLLVARGAPVPADELIEAGWPPDRRAGAARSLSVRLAKLRALLEPGRAPGAAPSLLVREPAGYRLALPPDSVDAEQFTRLAEEAGALRGAAARECCERALALWRGEPFADLDGVEAAAAEARRLHGVRDRLRRLGALALLDGGRADDAARELAALVEDDPLREELVRDLMRAHYRAGRQADALGAYRALARRLGRLGLQPGPEVRELEAHVLRHAEQLAPRTANVGARVASVVGRERELRDVLAALEAHRIVTIAGPGGVGKTTLALEAARALQAGIGAWVVELEPWHDPAEVAGAVAATLGLRRVGHGAELDERDALELLRERLCEEPALLLLDGAEHLLPGLARVARDLAAAGAGVKVLATSRRPLGVAGEAVLPLEPLAVPADGALEAVAGSPAGRLFVERARAARPRWRLTAADAGAVARICRRLDGLPLALELAASRLRALSAGEVADRLGGGLVVLDASIEASHRLLSPAERELFRRLSVFEGAFGIEDAERVGAGDGVPREAVLELLVSLTEHSMVQCEGEAPRRYRMLAPLRDHARGRLDERTAAATTRRHAEHVARLAAEAAALADGAGAEAAGEPLVHRRADLDAAFRYALGQRDADLALDLAAGLGALHHRLGTVPLGVALMDRALALGGGDPARRRGVLWWHVPLVLAELRVAAARASLAQLKEIAGGEPGVLLAEGQLELCAGSLEAAEALLTGLPEELARRGDRFLAGNASWALGTIALVRGAPAAAVPLMTVARDHYAACADVCSLDAVAADLVAASTAAGLDREAADACEHALAFAPRRPLGERNTHLLHEAAVIAARAGDGRRAARLAESAATAANRDPVAIGPWHAPVAAGDVALLDGRLDTARGHYERALALATGVRAQAGPSLPVALYLASSELRLADVAAAAGDDDAAAAHAEAALEHAPAVAAR